MLPALIINNEFIDPMSQQMKLVSHNNFKMRDSINQITGRYCMMRQIKTSYNANYRKNEYLSEGFTTAAGANDDDNRLNEIFEKTHQTSHSKRLKS